MMPLSGGVPGQPLGGSREVVQAGSQHDQLKLGVSMDRGNRTSLFFHHPRWIIAYLGRLAQQRTPGLLSHEQERPLGPQNGG